MSRGPGAIEREILDQLKVCGIRDAFEIAVAIFAIKCRDPSLIIDKSRLTPAQIGSVRRALRRLAKGRVIEPAVWVGPNGRTKWKLAKRTKRVRRAATTSEAVPARPHPPADLPWRPAGAPIPLGNPDAPVPFAASTRVLGLRRHPVQLNRRRRSGDQGLY